MSKIEDRYIVVANLVASGRACYEWEIWDRQEARSVHTACARYGSVHQAWAAGAEARTTRWKARTLEPDASSAARIEDRNDVLRRGSDYARRF